MAIFFSEFTPYSQAAHTCEKAALKLQQQAHIVPLIRTGPTKKSSHCLKTPSVLLEIWSALVTVSPFYQDIEQ